MAEATPGVISKIKGILPKGFPDSVSEPILTGLEAAAKKLDSKA
jgi:hypothetical protein